MPSRPTSFLPHLLFLAFIAACGSDDAPSRGRDAGSDAGPVGDDTGPVTGEVVQDASRPDASQPSLDAAVDAAGNGALDAQPDATTACIPKGCDELGFQCGQGVDNCNNPIDCNLAGGASPCTLPERCGGNADLGPNKCGCKPRADACAAQGAQCGMVDECGMPVQCGSCTDGKICLGNVCACTPNSDPCGGKVCGSAPDGCGGMKACGANNGQCASGTCSAAGACECRPRADACAGKTGPFTENGCSYDCNTACVPDNATACAGAECGTATNNCGEVVQCGTAAGACAAGSACVGPQFILDSTLPARTATYQGGYCIPQNAANFIGKYAARAHLFRQAGSGDQEFLNRAEVTSLITNRYSRATGKAQMTDVGCTATTLSSPKFTLGARSIIADYRNLDPVVIDITLTGDQWRRDQSPHPILGTGLPSGFALGMPAFCAGKEGQQVDLPAGDVRRTTFWPDGKCTCPTVATANVLPANTYSDTVSRDCRIVDSDGDGKPGFTAAARSIIPFPSVYSANISHGVWEGQIRGDRYHVGTVSEAVQPEQRSVLGCSATGTTCVAPDLDCGCPERLQPIQFVPLADNETLSCDSYDTPGASAFSRVKQANIDSQFAKTFGTCSATAPCPSSSVCRGGQCFPATSKGACAACPTGASCDPCPAEMECLADDACWPRSTDAVCPPRSRVVGTLCGT